MACAGCGGSTLFGFKWTCTNRNCRWTWCNNCAKGLLFRSCRRCGGKCV
ncbi:MAG: hypothetical protein QGG40_16210 [Myxococcota bacterium]|nr:hypothetical protein [Myxococcota bacterium]